MRIDEAISDLYFKIKYPFVKKIFRNLKRNGPITSTSEFTYNEIIQNMYFPSTYYSGYGQDYYLSSILLNYISHHSDSWVVDVGAGEPEFLSNSLYFEKYYNCQILAIDAVEEFADKWSELRPKSNFVISALGASEAEMELRMPMNNELTSSFIFGHAHDSKIVEYSKRRMMSYRLECILEKHAIQVVMLLLINVNGSEFEVLKGLNFNKVEVKCILLRNASSNLIGCNDVRKYLVSRNYVFVARLADNDDVFLHQSMINGIPNWFNSPVTTI
jgi:FkbM family methyltransferase